MALSSSLLLSVVSQPPQSHSLSGPYTGGSLCFQHSSFRSSQSCFLFVIQIFIKVSAFQRGHPKYQMKAVSQILIFSTVDTSALHDLLFLFKYLFLSFQKIGLVGRTLACDWKKTQLTRGNQNMEEEQRVTHQIVHIGFPEHGEGKRDEKKIRP